MAIRVVARIRPQQKIEVGQDLILSIGCTGDTSSPANVVKIPNPKNEAEAFAFNFSGVYDSRASQQDIFEREISPTIKHLFGGFDVTIFAYGSTGTGKTHTMRGGKALADRGIIPRLLSGIYRRARKIEKDSNGGSKVEITLSYYEIYNDKVFDLFEAPERRSLAGLSLRDNGTKTVVVGLTERPCESLKKFEHLYDQANVNRSTSATKLNAASSRSHAILGIKIAVLTGNEVRTSIASAIDLAGSEDNRRTDNGKERMVESASINRSLFTLAKCVEAISHNQSRIPYRESKMTRILSLGQNNGLTVMILNLAPGRTDRLDTLSSLNFASRTKKIEVREVENEPIFKGCSRAVPSFTGENLQRQPLRPLASTAHNVAVSRARLGAKQDEKPKAFAVYSDRPRSSNAAARSNRADSTKQCSPLKRPLDSFTSSASRPPKRRSPDRPLMRAQPAISQQAIEDIIERKVNDVLAARALDQPSILPQLEISEEVQRRLGLLEQKIVGKDDGREKGLTFLLCAKQHAVRGEDGSALRMYTLAKEFFPDNKKLDHKIEKLRKKIQLRKQEDERRKQISEPSASEKLCYIPEHDDYRDDARPDHDSNYESDGAFHYSSKAKTKAPARAKQTRVPPAELANDKMQSPGTRKLLDIINSRDVAQIRLLKGVGAKKAEGIIEALCSAEAEEATAVRSMGQLGLLKGVGVKTVENMRAGLQPLMSNEIKDA